MTEVPSGFVKPRSRHVVVSLHGATLADSTDPVLLFETNLPTRYYLPTDDVNFDALPPSSNTSMCPYKGIADRYWDAVQEPGEQNVA